MNNQNNQTPPKSKGNPTTSISKGKGRPLKYKSVQGLQKSINKYFDNCDKTKEPYTVSGLALALGTNRHTLLDYESGNRDGSDGELTDINNDFSHTIVAAKEKIARQWERKLYDRGNAGDIFALKNFGWRDRTEVETTHKGNVSFINNVPRRLEEPEIIEGEVVDDDQ